MTVRDHLDWYQIRIFVAHKHIFAFQYDSSQWSGVHAHLANAVH